MTIKQARKKADLTQQETSVILEIPVQTIKAWERGARKCPYYVEKRIFGS